MARHGRWLRSLTIAAMLCVNGCMPFLHQVDPPNKEQIAPSASVLAAARNHVHIFLIHGMDPFDWANLAGVRDYVQSLGYIKTHYGQLYHIWQFKNEIHQIHKEDPDARFVLIGFSFGANMVCNLAQDANDNHIPIDLLIYLGGNTLKDCPEDKPENALHIVNILATGCIWNGDHLEGAENYKYDDVWHFGSPTHPKTLDVLAEELAKVAARIPVVVEEPRSWRQDQDKPRQVVPPKKRDEWDFLLPTPPGEEAPAPREIKQIQEKTKDKE